jgi:hypothetical protein
LTVNGLAPEAVARRIFDLVHGTTAGDKPPPYGVPLPAADGHQPYEFLAEEDA